MQGESGYVRFAPLVSSLLHILLEFDPSSRLFPLHSVGGRERDGGRERRGGGGERGRGMKGEREGERARGEGKEERGEGEEEERE